MRNLGKDIYVMRKNLDGGLLHAMHAFLKVIDSGSFTAAAEQMDLTTAQVSRLISELESRLGVKLMQRSTRQHALTDIGALYAERCRQVLSIIDEAESEATGTATKPKGRLRILSMASFGHYYISPVMAKFCQSYPDLTVEYRTSQNTPDLLGKGIDVSLYLTESLTDSRFVSRRIGTIFSVLCASPAYLEKHGIPNSPEDLYNHACLRLVNPSITPEWHLINEKGGFHEISTSGQIVADTPELLLDVVQQDMANTRGYTRQQMDDFAIRSLQRAQKAITEGYFKDEIVPVTVSSRKGDVVVDQDEQPLNAKIDKIPSLKPAFAKDGTITAANASSISDGASALVLTSADVASARGLQPLAKIIATASNSQHPSEFTIAPVGAIEKVLKKAGWDAQEVDLWEINEAFAMVTMCPIDDFKLDAEKVNINGGACALGHPVGSTGSRIILTLIHALKRTGGKKGVAALCIGGGEATAVAIELI